MEIDEWAADLGKTVCWHDLNGIADISYTGRSRFTIDNDVLAVAFQLRFG